MGFNWRWRLIPGQITGELAEEIKAMTIRANRGNWDAINANKVEEDN